MTGYLWSRVSAAEGPEAVFFDLGFGFPKLSHHNFDRGILGGVILREAKRVNMAPSIFAEKFVKDTEGLNPPAHPGFDEIRAL